MFNSKGVGIMKKSVLSAILAVACLFGHNLATDAQELKTSYFLDHYNYGYRINPAYVPEDNIEAIWGLLIDNVTAASNSNIGLSSFVFPVDGQLVTGLHESVPAAQFLSALNEHNILNAAVNANIFTVGFRTDPKGFGTVELNLRSNNYSNIPKGLFEFLKMGGKEGSPNQFNIDNFQIRSTTVAEIALGHSRKIGEHFKVGGRLKFLLGIADADLMVDNMVLDIPRTSADQWNISGSGSMRISAPVKMNIKEVQGKSVYDINSIHLDVIGLSGFGAAADLGVKYSPFKGLEFDASVRDLGLMFWNRTLNGMMNYVASFASEDLKSIQNDLSKILNFTPETRDDKFKQFLNATFLVGAKYHMPFYDKMSVALVDTYKLGAYKYNDLRVGVTVTPIEQISLTANYGYTSYGSTFGVAANFNLGFAELFFGTDGFIFNFTPQGVPIDKLNTVMNMGLLIQLKKAKSK